MGKNNILYYAASGPSKVEVRVPESEFKQLEWGPGWSVDGDGGKDWTCKACRKEGPMLYYDPEVTRKNPLQCEHCKKLGAVSSD